MTGGEFDLSVIIVNWNTRHLIDACLGSLTELQTLAISSEVLVVDNGSTDGSVTYLASAWPDVQVIANDQNRGYQKANNQAIEQSRGEALLLLNADARIVHGAIAVMMQCLEHHPEVAVVGPRLEYEDGSFQRWTAGRAPDLSSAARYWLFLERIRTRTSQKSLYLTRDTRSAFTPDWVSSACMLIRKQALDEVGLLDERYFVYMDDVDLCQRLRDRGWSIRYEPAATVVHHMGGASAHAAGEASPVAIENFNDYFLRRHGPGALQALRAIQLVGYGARAVAYATRSLFQPGSVYRRKSREHVRNARVVLRSVHKNRRVHQPKLIEVRGDGE